MIFYGVDLTMTASSLRPTCQIDFLSQGRALWGLLSEFEIGVDRDTMCTSP